ncbi:heavy metal-associated isoprenylated plant protein 21-like isoform X2 [Salvia miltiorrhiza]|uniref:heavy metal-associated isoprenylated plant protein 21-like isoform X2 n=1 Tax=Salvia miltiorrhiza TaxID=226208 RepID=UPI0025AC2475|nr:heavy metal-associated isoprenylated plant protein 21-like isoform X2 [Salvia miltiorrhiza]
MGALKYLSKLCSATTTRSKRKSMQTVEIRVKMDCDGCERRVKNAIKNIKGVKSIDINRKLSRVTVNGFVDPNKVLKRVNNTGKKAEFWPFIPYNVVQFPHVSQVYDKKAPAGFVRNVQAAAAPPPNATEEAMTYLFSEDNPNACSIM